MSDYPTLRACPFCGGESEFEQTGRYELTLRCVGAQASGLRGCGPKYVQKVLPTRQTLEWLAEIMAKTWNKRTVLAELEDDTRQIAVDICDAVLQWIVKHDLGHPDDEFTVGDVISILDDLWGDVDDQPGDPKAAEEVLRKLTSPAHLDQHGQGGE